MFRSVMTLSCIVANPWDIRHWSNFLTDGNTYFKGFGQTWYSAIETPFVLLILRMSGFWTQQVLSVFSRWPLRQHFARTSLALRRDSVSTCWLRKDFWYKNCRELQFEHTKSKYLYSPRCILMLKNSSRENTLERCSNLSWHFCALLPTGPKCETFVTWLAEQDSLARSSSRSVISRQGKCTITDKRLFAFLDWQIEHNSKLIRSFWPNYFPRFYRLRRIWSLGFWNWQLLRTLTNSISNFGLQGYSQMLYRVKWATGPESNIGRFCISWRHSSLE